MRDGGERAPGGCDGGQEQGAGGGTLEPLQQGLHHHLGRLVTLGVTPVEETQKLNGQGDSVVPLGLRVGTWHKR